MTAEAQWDSTRWRGASQPARYNDLQQHPQTAGTQTQSGVREHLGQPWYASSHSDTQQYDYDSRREGQTYGSQASQYAPPDQFASGGNYGRSNNAPYPSNIGSQHHSWPHTPSQNASANEKRASDAPLSLQIPHRNTELPSIAHGYTTPRSDAPMYSSSTSSWSHHTTSLPSFAALSEHTTRNEEPDEVEIAPMSARLSCSQCAKLAPLVREAATVLAELDGSIQSLCSASAIKVQPPEVPRESTMRTVQWILDRVRYTKRDLQDAVESGTVDRSRSHMASSMHHSNPLKRTADQWDSDEMPTLKFPRPMSSLVDGSYGDRRTSIDFATRDPVQRSAYSPAPSDSAPGSAYPRTGSPTAGRPPRALPSPSSLACPPSGAASFVPANAASVGSPGTSHHPASSIHTVSTNSATSAHLQDLQHQVSLKSLALQTLQTEYATLLQKLQRERIKSQTIEKKTTVADQEVNDLTTRNEELLEQIKTLEGQLQECERKREAERADAAQEKEQWGRMLDMSGRLQSKNAEDRQRMANEKAELLQRLAAYEGTPARLDQPGTGLERSASRSPFAIDKNANGGGLTRSLSSTGSNNIDALRRENDALQTRITSLRTSLEEVRRYHGGMEDTMQCFIAQRDFIRQAVDQALGNEKPTSIDMRSDASREEHTSTAPGESPPSNSAPNQLERSSLPAPRSYSNPRIRSPANAPSKQGQAIESTDPLRPENLAHARAVSPSPAELGFHVQPSTSSPEELIKALGPVPAPLPPMRFAGFPSDDSIPSSDSSRQQRQQSQPLVAPLSLPPNAEVSAFRPLNQAQSVPPYGHSGQYSGFSPPHSYHSSPGPNVSNTSSPGTTSTQSPEYGTSRKDDFSTSRRHSQPHVFPGASPSTAAMPPPPRPLP